MGKNLYRRLNDSFSFVLLFAWSACCAGVASADEFWELTPYRIRVLLDVDVWPGTEPRLATEVASYLIDRCAATAGPIWQIELGAERPESAWFGAEPPDLTGDAFPPAWAEYDKLLLVRVDRQSDVSRVTAREFDVATRRFGTRIERSTRQRRYVPQTVYATFRAAFSPIAQFRVDREDEEHVLLSFKGQGLAAAVDDFRLYATGDVLVPIFRRNDREGRPRPDGIQQVPWTYLVVEPQADDSPLLAKIFSGTKRPFGVRRRGRIEQFALAAQLETDATVLHLTGRIDPTQPMAGCRVFERENLNANKEENGKSEFRLLGVSDRAGTLRVEPADTPVRMVWIKSGKLLLAKLPVVPGLRPTMQVPLPEDEIRLETEGKLTALRNNLIDLVARRSILIVRIRTRLDAGDIDEAQRLFARLDDLPRRPEFRREIDQLEQVAKSDDPQTQRRITGLFTRTKAVLGSFLDSRELTRLQDKINAAKRAE